MAHGSESERFMSLNRRRSKRKIFERDGKVESSRKTKKIYLMERKNYNPY